jgi:hypothetical protein
MMEMVTIPYWQFLALVCMAGLGLGFIIESVTGIWGKLFDRLDRF